MTKSKKTHTTKRSHHKIQKPMIIIGIILLVILALSYIILGFELTCVLTIGILIILGIARLLDKIKSKPKRRKVLNIILIFFLIIAIIIALLASAFIVMIVKKAPEFDITQLEKREASIFLDSTGEEFYRLGDEMRENITYDDLPEVFIDALVATEDSRFFQHNGFDAPRFIKASIGQILGKSNAGGGSTLSMQLIKNTYTSRETRGLDGIIRKFTDIYLAVFKLEKNFTKKEIIEYYANNLELGSNAWGVEQASQTFFDKSVRDLNLSEASLLVGLFNAPGAYNPFSHPDKAASRRAEVLNSMIRQGYVTQEEADIANSIPVTSLLTKTIRTSEYAGYIDTVLWELENKYGINPKITPVIVYTNMDRNKQKGIDDIFNGQSSSYTWLNDTVTAGSAVVEVATGKIVAIGAGHNRSLGHYNFAVQGTRQIGSTAKPIFDYGPAIEYLGWNTYTQILDEPHSYSSGQAINNSDGQFWGWISMRTALSQSRNIPALKAFQAVQDQVGNQKIIEFATNLGITPDIQNGKIYEAHALGAFSKTTPLQMAAAYAAFANGGTYTEPLTVNKIVYREDNTAKVFEPKQTKAMSEATAFMITDMLKTSVNSGMAGGVKMNGVDLAAKTGTTNLSNEDRERLHLPGNTARDAWVVGYDPEYAVSMWYGYDTITSEHYNVDTVAVRERTKLYKAIANVVFNKNSGKTFTPPSNVVQACVENGSNPPALPSANTPQDQITCEYFIKGSEPTDVSSKYSKLATVKNLKVTYNEKTKKITISWSKLNTPTENESFGAFGYNVYYGDILLDFTTSNSYTIEASSNISGTYKVVTTFEKYSGNQSDPAVYKFEYKEKEPTVSPSPSPSTSPSPTTSPSPSSSPSATPSPSTSPTTTP